MADCHTLRTPNMFNAPAHAAFDAWTSEEVTRRWFHAGHKARLGALCRTSMRRTSSAYGRSLPDGRAERPVMAVEP
jgi:uncharacterized protein YndB with AHSA1/START domain